jgi:hypothetical protein
MVNQRGLGGIGIWALGYDDGMSTYWNLIRDKFSDCAPLVCNDSLFDMGGPTRNYYDSEKYAFTLSAPTGSLVNLQFKSFGTELNYDTLWLYNGTTTLSPLIGSYTGTNSPGTVTSSSTALTLRFKSDGSTNTFGFKLIRSCIPQVIPTSLDKHLLLPVKVYPNPTNGVVNVELEECAAIKLIDLHGRVLEEFFTCERKYSFDLLKKGWAQGVYTLQISTADGQKRSCKLVFAY